MRSLFSLTVILYALSPFPAGAADAWTLIDTQRHDELARVDRLQIAADLIGRLDLLLAHIPRQSPREAEKVADRLATLDAPGRSTEHRGRFFLSTAYQHYQLVALLNDARSSLACATAATAEAAEMNCWARAADAYLAEERIDVGVATLRAARLLPRDDDMPRNAQDPRVWYTEFGRGILRRIITPWLAALAAENR
ncbi:MAG: hypothetical protein R3E84_09420 [Pseudomonadales bacterium]